MKVYIIKKYRDHQFYTDKNDKCHLFFVSDMEDILKFLRQYNGDYNEIFDEESVKWREDKEGITWTYYDSWDDKKEYPNEDYLDIIEIKSIKEL